MATAADISILGPGRVGTALAIRAAQAGLRVVVGGRRTAAAAEAAEKAGHGTIALPPARAAGAAPLVLLTVSDPAIAGVCDELAETFASGAVVAHVSGAVDSGVLASARDHGCSVGSMHPLQTFPEPARAAESFPGTFCFLEGDPAAVAALGDLAERLGGRPLSLPAGGKALYHAAAVLGCNCLVALLDAARAAAEAAGVPPESSLAAFEPIVRTTVDNIFSLGPADALTGPVARGDVETVERHVHALTDAEAAAAGVYRAMGVWTVDLARRAGRITDAQADALRQALAERPKDQP